MEKEKIIRFIKLQNSGVINMNHIVKGVKLTGMSKEDYKDILLNYEKYRKEFKLCTIQEKQRLLQEFSSRLPYGVICNTPKGDGPLCSINQTLFGTEYGINIKATERDYFNDREEIIKPYLRPMESMTTEEICKIENIIGCGFTYIDGGTLTLCTEEFIRLPIYKISNLIQFIYSRHLDLNNLIPMCLALEAPEGMYR